MARAPKELLAEARDLPEEERAPLARSLIASLDEMEEEDPTEIERTWLAEVSRRAAEIDAGAVRMRPAVEVFHAAREELRARVSVRPNTAFHLLLSRPIMRILRIAKEIPHGLEASYSEPVATAG